MPMYDFSRPRPLIECAQCGEPLSMPEWTEPVDESRLRHLWHCMACNYFFETIASFHTEAEAA
jgi:hypothetical protein